MDTEHIVIYFMYLFIHTVTHTETQNGDHLKYKHIKDICNNSEIICKSNNTRICAARLSRNKMEFLDYENSCFLFIDNMCRHFGNEYTIVSDGYCIEYFKSRRNLGNNTTTNKNQSSDKHKATTKSILREKAQFSTLYETDTAFDYHICPLSCPEVYNPVCVGVNRGHGSYYKFFTFVNHCAGDLYYCKHWQEFSPPPDEEEMVKSSPLSWSYCAANRYIQFARFTELTSSMGHYGWLAGDYKPTHIMEPHERKPGYG